jgi:hypothetical protein
MIKIPLVNAAKLMKPIPMSRLKTLSLPLASLLALWTATPVHSQNTYFSLATSKTFRQGTEKEHAFRGGALDLAFRDGLVVFRAGCVDSFFFNPGGGCPLGSNGFITFGAFGSEPDPTPYLSVLSVTPALIVEPTLPDSPHLYAAPASKLPRPLYGFEDGGIGLFYDLFNPDSLREYKVTVYNYSREYDASELTRMNQETVPGTYYFRFPKLNSPEEPVILSATVRALPEGFAKLNSVFTGVNFDTGLGFDSDGFMRVNFNRPTTLRWSGFGSNLINANTDRLYFSIRYLSDPTDSQSETSFTNPATGASPASIFPGFVSGRDPRVTLANPFVTSYTIPPIFPIGSTGVVELELNRNLANSGLVFDTSSRRYQIPIRFSSYYSDYAARSFGSNSRKTGIEEDFDGDTFNNLTEWVLNSRAQDFQNIPANLKVKFVPAVFDTSVVPPLVITPAYFGLKTSNSQGYVPGVIKTLQRSTAVAPVPDNWTDMVSDDDWDLIYTETTIELLSKRVSAQGVPILPPGTTAHKFRFRVSLETPSTP